jgi:hypothetical protein
VQVSAGAELVPVQVPRKPNEVDALAARFPLYEAFRTVIGDVVPVATPFQTWVTVWPLANVSRTVQPVIAAVPAVTVTLPWKPPVHELTWE